MRRRVLKIKTFNTFYVVSFIFIAVFSLYSCGYSILRGASLPFESVKIGKLTGPGETKDKFYVAVTEAFMRHGIKVTNSSENLVEGNISSINLAIISEEDRFATAYRANIRATLTITESDGKKRSAKSSNPFLETFPSTDEASDFIALRERIEDEAIKKLAIKLISELLYIDKN